MNVQARKRGRGIGGVETEKKEGAALEALPLLIDGVGSPFSILCVIWHITDPVALHPHHHFIAFTYTYTILYTFITTPPVQAVEQFGSIKVVESISCNQNYVVNAPPRFKKRRRNRVHVIYMGAASR
ncbi:hypothetical protein L1887_20643 [Cichorium endivia]|nr:hypothetical protein L1887_20643 [Cichorium endivia]